MNTLGFTVPRIDEILVKYAEKSFKNYSEKHYKSKMRTLMKNLGYTSEDEVYQNFKTDVEIEAKEEAMEDVRRDMEQGFQGLEIKLNTVASSRGDYPFTTFTIGASTNPFATLAAEMCLEVRKKGQGAPGKKKCVLFPKLVFTYTDDLHGKGKELEWLFEKSLDCSMKAMYPDYLSLDGDTTVAEMWHKYGEIIAPMGCVSGKSTVQILNNNYRGLFLKDQIMPFENLWELLSTNIIPNNGKHNQPGSVKNFYIDPIDLKIWDINANDYVSVKRVIRNVTSRWVEITLRGVTEKDQVKTIKCTLDHPFPIIGKGRIEAANVNIGDTVNGRTDMKNPTVFEVVKIGYSNETDYSYDVTTESDRFMVNGIDSHNCRAFLSPYWERGGVEPADENDRPFFTGRFNIGVVSLNLPMIYAKSQQENKDFYEVLDEYLELGREVHIMTYKYLSNMKASTNPIAFCQGGLHNGYLQPHEKIKPLLEYATASFGITALNELNRIHNGKSIREDGQFPLEVMQYINKKTQEFKKEDHINYAIYGTPKHKWVKTQ